jgi:hypothetical protein
VVNGGAGGDQMPDGYGHRLFHACQRIAATLATEGHPAMFVLVTGPYYAGAPLQPSRNVTVRRFEPRLAALLAAADVAVIKPGNNALSEALAGPARLVLVPDRSFMEGLDEHAARIAARYGGAVGRPEPATLEPLIREALARPPRRDWVTPSSDAINRVVDELHEQADGMSRIDVSPKRLLLMVTAPSEPYAPSSRALQLPARLRGAVVVGADHPDSGVAHVDHPGAGHVSHPYGLIVGGDAPDDPPQSLVDRGTRMIIETSRLAAVDRWLHQHPTHPALLVAEADRIVARSDSPDSATRRIARLLRSQATAVVLLDLTNLSSVDATAYLDHLGNWVTRQPLRLAGVREIAAQLAGRWVET